MCQAHSLALAPVDAASSFAVPSWLTGKVSRRGKAVAILDFADTPLGQFAATCGHLVMNLARKRDDKGDWTASEIATLIEDWMKGATRHAIGLKLDRSPASVASRASRMGLPPRVRSNGTVVDESNIDAIPLPPAGDVQMPIIRKDARRPNAKMRKCLMHGGMFWSEHPGHRICNLCKETEEFQALGNIVDGHDSSVCSR
jgi:hypothetical protein